jgi:hypothetical protein
MGVGGQSHALAVLSPGIEPAPIVPEEGWNPGPVWKVDDYLASIGIRSPHRPARSESLYRLRDSSPH